MDDFKTISDYYSEVCSELASELDKVLEDLSTQVTIPQKRETWYLYLNWRYIDEKHFLQLCMAVNYYETNLLAQLEGVKRIVYIEMKEQLRRVCKRFSGDPKTSNWSKMLLYDRFASIYYLGQFRFFLPPTEWEGNYRNGFQTFIRRNYVLRYNTPRREKKQDRVRGYRDHGSMSSVHDRARRAANTANTQGITQEGYVVDHNVVNFSKEQNLLNGKKPDD